ncbi:MAG: hypothetical protein DRN20_01920 [Thermoplasmata archaeon]|nr:MAG: hypothetical protein DRN20_01920 [Thermoplasmata archaeon]
MHPFFGLAKKACTERNQPSTFCFAILSLIFAKACTEKEGYYARFATRKVCTSLNTSSRIITVSEQFMQGGVEKKLDLVLLEKKGELELVKLEDVIDKL